MRADADEAAHRFAVQGIVTAGLALLQGVAGILSGDLDEGDAFLENAVSLGENTGAHEVLAAALSQRSLLAMKRGQWRRAHALAEQAGTVLGQAGIEASYVTPLVCAAQARSALHQGDIPAARHQLISAQRLRSLQTYAIPHVALQTRIELTRAHLTLADPAGARTLMREIDELLKRLAIGHSGRRSRGAAGSAVKGARPRHPRSIGPDRGRAASSRVGART